MMDAPPPFDALWFRSIVGLVIGLAVGSFVTMLSYRLPRRISIISPRSHCPTCKATLKPRELVPVISWMVQRGNCRTCGTFTGWRYLLIELVTGFAVMMSFILIGFTFLLLLPIILTVAVITALAIWLER
jgi:prepilin signal peptidase PulO-like enzyme (type II secretory pathway)